VDIRQIEMAGETKSNPDEYQPIFIQGNLPQDLPKDLPKEPITTYMDPLDLRRACAVYEFQK